MQHEMDLLGNALDSLTEALVKFEEAEDGDESAYKFTVLHLSHFIELVLKYHITSRHPLLIYKDPFAPKLNKNKTIGLWDAINFINNEAPETVSKEFKKDLVWLKELRNQIEHHKFSMDTREARTTIGRLFRSLLEFLEEYSEVEIESHLPSRAKETFKVLSDEYEFSLREALKEADAFDDENQPKYSNNPDAWPPRIECADCGHPTLLLNEESRTGYRCIFCGNEDGDEIPANCSICGVFTTEGELFYWETEHAGTEARCYYCAGRHHLEKDD